MGDNDSGSSLNRTAAKFSDTRYLLDFGTVFFREPRSKTSEFY